jgi:hypothetical protein
MAHTYVDGLQTESDSPASCGAGLGRKDIAKYAELLEGCGIQTEASDKPKNLDSDSDSPTCYKNGMGRKEISRLTSAIGYCDGQDEASDSGVGGTGSYGKPDPKPIKPKPKCCYGRTNTSARRIRNKFMSAPKNDSENTRCGGNVSKWKSIEELKGAFIGDCGGQDEIYDSGKGGTTSSGSDTTPPDDASRRRYRTKFSQPHDKDDTSVWCIGSESRLETMAESMFSQGPDLEGCDDQIEAYDSDKGGTTSGGIEPPKPKPSPSPRPPPKAKQSREIPAHTPWRCVHRRSRHSDRGLR